MENLELKRLSHEDLIRIEGGRPLMSAFEFTAGFLSTFGDKFDEGWNSWSDFVDRNL